jgi:hypothetical protein
MQHARLTQGALCVVWLALIACLPSTAAAAAACLFAEYTDGHTDCSVPCLFGQLAWALVSGRHRAELSAGFLMNHGSE